MKTACFIAIVLLSFTAKVSLVLSLHLKAEFDKVLFRALQYEANGTVYGP